MNSNDIIKTEGREVMPERLSVLAEEIRYYSTNLLMNIIEIGRRFSEAKSICPHGEWGKWTKEMCGYESSMTENYIKIYKEYGGGQLNLGGDFENSQSIATLGVTKLLELTKVPADERVAFVEEHNITNDTTVKELQALIKAEQEKNTELERELDDARRNGAADKTMLEAKIALLEGREKSAEKKAADSAAEIERLQERIREIEENPTEADDSAVAELIADAENRAKEEMRKEVERLTAEKEKAKKEARDYKEKIKAEKEKTKESENAADEIRRKYEELTAELARTKKESQAADNQDILKINVIFEDIQKKIQSLKELFEGIGNVELKIKVMDVLKKQIEE